MTLSNAPTLDAVTTALGKVLGSGRAVVIDIRPNEYASRSRSWLISVETGDSGTLELFCKAGPGNERNAVGHPTGIDYEAFVYEQLLGPWNVAAPTLYGWVAGEDYSYLVLGSLARHVRVAKAAQPDAIVAAAGWLGQTHRECSAAARNGWPARLNRYRAETLRKWLSNAVAATGSARLARLAAAEHDADIFGVLTSVEATLVHGDCYPNNVLIRQNTILAVDWEWAGWGPGEIDLAALTEAWGDEVIRRCTAAYAATRWPEGITYDVDQMVARAQLYLYARWLGEKGRDGPGTRRVVRALEKVMSQLGVRP